MLMPFVGAPVVSGRATDTTSCKTVIDNIRARGAHEHVISTTRGSHDEQHPFYQTNAPLEKNSDIVSE